MFIGICFLRVIAVLLQQACFQAAPYPNFLPINAKQTNKSHWQKTTWGGYDLFHWLLIVYHEGQFRAGAKGRNLQAGTRADWQRRATCWLTLLAFLCNPSPPTQEWFSCWLLINKMSSRSCCLSGYLMETFVNWGSFSQLSLVCVKLTNNYPAKLIPYRLDIELHLY